MYLRCGASQSKCCLNPDAPECLHNPRYIRIASYETQLNQNEPKLQIHVDTSGCHAHTYAYSKLCKLICVLLHQITEKDNSLCTCSIHLRERVSTCESPRRLLRALTTVERCGNSSNAEIACT